MKEPKKEIEVKPPAITFVKVGRKTNRHLNVRKDKQLYKEGLEIPASDELKKLDEKIHALEWLVNFSSTEEDKEIHEETIHFFKEQRERIKRANSQI